MSWIIGGFWFIISLMVMLTRLGTCSKEMEPIDKLMVALICFVGGPVIALGSVLETILTILMIEDDE